MPIPIRGLRTIRTLAGKERFAVPHRVHLHVARLEVEKARCVTERTNSLRRVAELDARLRDIEAEQTTLLQALAERRAGQRVDTLGHGRGAVPQRSAVAFKIKY
jgi:hypothetical protein